MLENLSNQIGQGGSDVFWVTTIVLYAVFFLACHSNRWELYLADALVMILWAFLIWDIAFALALFSLILGILSLFRTFWAMLGRVPKINKD